MILNKTEYCIFLFLLLLVSGGVYSKEIDKSYSIGLTFRSHEVNKDERTKADFTFNNPIHLTSGFTLEFDLKLRYSPHSYGYVFRLIENDTASLDMTSYIGENRINFILNDVKGTQAFSEYKFDRNSFENRWVKVKIRIAKDSIFYSLGEKNAAMRSSFSNSAAYKILFGANNHRNFYTSDVPPMSIRNLIIRDKHGNIVRNWNLSKHGAGVVYDEKVQAEANIYNGIWELDKHAEWNKEVSFRLSAGNPQIAYDSINRCVFAATKDSLFIIDIGNKTIRRIKVEGEPFVGASSQLIYDYGSNSLISYNIDQPELLYFDFEKQRWDGHISNGVIKIQHHNRFINTEMNELVVFGGYGFYKYSAVLATRNLSVNNWVYTDLINEITPRYLASMTYLGKNKILIFGGYGSSTGVQEEAARNLYDLYEIDTQTKKCIKLGEIADMQAHLTFGNSMVVDPRTKRIYTLGYRNDVYKSYLNLYEINMSDMSYRMLADSVPYHFQDTESFCDMFLYKDKSLYSIVSQKTDDGDMAISIYSLLFPPLAKSDILQEREESNSIMFSVITILVITLAGIVFFIFYKKCRQRNEERVVIRPINREMGILPFTQKKNISSILLFGGFQVFDTTGNDITASFTPVIRQMFLIILLESNTSGKGITSERLDETFWFDMDKNKATNNRNVNISKLRLLLQDIGEIKLQKNGNYWQVLLGEDVFCDYIATLPILNNYKNVESIDKFIAEKVVDLTSSGVLLPNIIAEWVDKFKSGYSILLIDFLLKYAVQDSSQKDLKFLVKLADVILSHDDIDEDAIRIKCRSLYKLGQKGLSKQSYDKFHSAYINILGEEPKLTYEMIITHK